MFYMNSVVSASEFTDERLSAAETRPVLLVPKSLKRGPCDSVRFLEIVKVATLEAFSITPVRTIFACSESIEWFFISAAPTGALPFLLFLFLSASPLSHRLGPSFSYWRGQCSLKSPALSDPTVIDSVQI